MRVARSLAPLLVVLGASSSIVGCKDAPPSRPAEAAAFPSATGEPTVAPSVPSSVPSAASAATDTCQTDAECILSTFPGCCSCCPCAKLHATTVSREASAKAACERKDCRSCKDFVGDCIGCTDPAKEGMRARCIANACTLVETKSSATTPAPVTCKQDDDCWFDDRHDPVARPASARGKKVRPCKDGEHVPACKDGTCMVHHYKC